MTLEQAALWGQLISTVAVLASLVFVGLQIRQNTRSQKVVAVDSLAAATRRKEVSPYLIIRCSSATPAARMSSPDAVSTSGRSSQRGRPCTS